MGSEFFIVGVYLLLIWWLLPVIPFTRRAELSSIQLRCLFALKILAGIACAVYFEKISSNPDYATYNKEGKIQYELLLSNPRLFFTDFSNDINTYGLGRLFQSENSFWGYLRFNLLHKFIAILNLLTHGNFYLNTIVFSSLIFFGHVAFYRIYREVYQGRHKWIIAACFCLPSLLLYTACVHKDGVVFLCLGIVSFCFSRMLQGLFKLKYIAAFFIGMLVIFLFRNYVVVALLPAMMVVLLCKFFPERKAGVLLASYLLFSLVFFGAASVSPALDLPAAVVQRKADFALLEGGKTNIAMNELTPDLKSFIYNLPQAINHALFRPYAWEFRHLGVILTALELLGYQFIILIFIFFRKKDQTPVHPFNIFGWALFANMMVIIGYTIPNIGAIVRYRSIFWIFLLAPLLCNIEWKKITALKQP